MILKLYSYLCVVLLAGFLFVGCSKSDDQRKFENEALTAPQNITETNDQGEIVNEDPDDWRVGPMYRGLINIGSADSEAPHPNPLGYNQNITIWINFNVSDPVDAIEIRKFRLPSDRNYPQLRYLQNDQLVRNNIITIEGQLIAEGSGDSGRGDYRIMIYDGNQNLISYGDVRIR